jgi:methyltransferase (TIGR00027 family)
VEANRFSRTAEAAAGARARHLREGEDPVFEDPFAIQLLGPAGRRMVLNPVVRILRDLLLGDLRWMAMGQVVVRSRFAEDALEEAIDAGATQYVILSAGLDSFALRRPDLVEKVRVFEVDHPATQAWKSAQLERIAVTPPGCLFFASVDFEHEGVAEGLGRTPYSSAERTFFSWLGTVPYLTEDAIFSTLRALVALSPPGSELVFDFGGSIEALRGNERRQVEKLLRFTARRGEPLLTFADPHAMLDRACALGFERVEVLDPAEQERRYLSGRSDRLRVLPVAHLARLRRV